MKVLIVHNQYQQRGGEDAVVEAESALLRERGLSVNVYLRHNDDVGRISKARLALGTFWSAASYSDIETIARDDQPDLIHVHNTFPLISPSILWAGHRLGIPVVQTLHNFRLFCPQAMFLRNDRLCEDCMGKTPWKGVVRRCYRDSALQSAVLTGMLGTHRAINTWSTKVTRYIALNDFCRRKFIEGGLPAERIAIKPNFVDFPKPTEREREGFLFVGRLSPEKGIDVLIRASALLDRCSLKVAGSGPLAHSLDGVPGIEHLGTLSSDEVRQQMVGAKALVLPSIWYENFPRTLVEAFACGLPVIASRIGALAELVDDGVTGLLFDPGDHRDLASRMSWAIDHPRELGEMGRAAREHYERSFTPEKNFAQLMTIYQEAIAARQEDIQ